MKTILLLGVYFVLVTTALALVFLPGARAVAFASWRRGADRLSGWLRSAQQAGQQSLSHAGGGGRQALGSMAGWMVRQYRVLLAALAVLVLLPLAAMVWRHWYQIETFDHTDVRIQDERIAALLAGERLVPPAPLPPEVFTTREVELVRPMARFASRDWDLLDPDFAQRLLMVYRIMREQHGYEKIGRASCGERV